MRSSRILFILLGIHDPSQVTEIVLTIWNSSNALLSPHLFQRNMEKGDRKDLDLPVNQTGSNTFSVFTKSKDPNRFL